MLFVCLSSGDARADVSVSFKDFSYFILFFLPPGGNGMMNVARMQIGRIEGRMEGRKEGKDGWLHKQNSLATK